MECKETMLKYGRTGMMMQKMINVGFLGIIAVGVFKTGLLRNQHRMIKFVGNAMLIGIIYKAISPVRHMATNTAVPFIMEKFDIKVSDEEKKLIEERFKAF